MGAAVNDLGEWLTALGEGRGVSLCPASIAGYYQSENLAYVPITGLEQSTIGVAWRLDRDGPLLRKFLGCVHGYVENSAEHGWKAIEHEAA